MIIENKTNMNDESMEKLNAICENIDENISGFDLCGFKGISIVSDNVLPEISDGRLENMTILLPKRKTEHYFANNNDLLVKSTIYHELCHVDLANKLPNLHALHASCVKKEDYISATTIMVYIEYVAHTNSYNFESAEIRSNFFKSICDWEWDFNNEEHKIYFIKAAPYIIARDPNSNFINDLDNEMLRENLIEIRDELKKITKNGIIDDYDKLIDLSRIVKKYINND